MPLRPCATPGCIELVNGGKCDNHRAKRYSDEAKTRGTAHERGYTRLWQKARALFLADNPLCSDPFGVHGKRLVIAAVIDHWEPHRGNMALFWDTSKWRPLCDECNWRKTAIDHGRSRETLPEMPAVQPRLLSSG